MQTTLTHKHTRSLWGEAADAAAATAAAAAAAATATTTTAAADAATTTAPTRVITRSMRVRLKPHCN